MNKTMYTSDENRLKSTDKHRLVGRCRNGTAVIDRVDATGRTIERDIRGGGT